VDRRALLGSIPLFQGMTERELDMLLALTTTKKLKRRAFLCRKGEPGNALFAVMEGRLRAIGEGRDGKEMVFNFMDPGDVIGEIALLDQQPRSATVQAVADSILLTLHRRDLLPFLERHPKAAIKLAAVLAKRIRNLSELMEDTVFLGLPSRLAKKLLSLAQRYGKPAAGGGVRIDQKLPQHELGELVGTSRESINKQLRQWGEDGLVQFEKGYVTIRDQERLEDLAELLPS
jgi:CRP/FNR family cyclic AMP-dependent transcriptional regulator